MMKLLIIFPKMVILNTTYVQIDPPERILGGRVELTPEQIAEAKIQEMKKEAVAIIEDQSAKETDRKRILQALKRGNLTMEEITEDFETSVEYVEQINQENI